LMPQSTITSRICRRLQALSLSRSRLSCILGHPEAQSLTQGLVCGRGAHDGGHYLMEVGQPIHRVPERVFIEVRMVLDQRHLMAR
jgi:hypothetical protein